MLSRNFRFLSTTSKTVTKGKVPSDKPTLTRPVRKALDNRPIIQEQRARNTALQSEAEAKNLDWRLVCSTILHRYPVITPDKEPWEVEYEKMEATIAEKHRELLIKELEGTPDSVLIEDKVLSKEEMLETLPFTPAPRITEADKTNDRHSLERRLTDSLFLIVRRNRGDFGWQFPQGKLQENETIADAAARILQRAGHADVDQFQGSVLSKKKPSPLLVPNNSYFVSKSPVGHYQYAYNPALQEKRKQFGARVFFTRAQYLGGSTLPVKISKKMYKDYAWIARDEVFEYFDPETAKFLYALLPY